MVAKGNEEGVDPVPLHGRTSTLAQVAAALDATERGESRTVLVLGASGMGKSALLEEAVHRANGRGFRTLEAGSVPRDTPVPYELVRKLVHALLPVPSGRAEGTEASSLPVWLGGGNPVGVVSGFPTVAVLPGGEAPAEKQYIGLFDLERSLIDLARHLLYAQLAELLRGQNPPTPLLIALDDLHHADRESIEFLRSFVTDLGTGRVILLVSLDSDTPAGGPRGEAIEALKAGPRAESITLGSLSLEETAGAIQDLHGGTPPSPEFLRAIYFRSKGVPGTVGRWGRRWKEGTPPGESGGAEGPAEVPFQSGSIPEETLRVLTFGAVIGRQFDLAIIGRALHRRSVEAFEPLLEPLVMNGTLRQRGPRRYEFAVPAVRQELYTRLTEAQRRLMHRNVARALEVGSPSSGPELFEIAWHYHLAGETVPSVDYNRRAADVAVRLYAYDAARLYLERALDSLRILPSPRPETERVVRISLGHVLGRLGRIGEAHDVLEPLRGSLPRPLPGGSPLDALFGTENRPELWAHALNARTVAERSVRAFRTKHELRWLAIAHRALGVAAWSLADPSAAEEHHRAAAELARVVGDARLEGQSLLDRAHLVRLLDPDGLALSRRLLTDAIERFVASGDAEWQARAYLDRSTVLRSIGRLNEALADLTAAAEQADRAGSSALQIWVELRTARVLVEEGRTGRARKSIERLRKLMGESPRREVDQQYTLIQGMLQEREGRLDKARALFERSLTLAADAGASGEAADTHRRLAELEGKLGRTDEARHHLDEADRLGGRTGRAGPGPRAD